MGGGAWECKRKKKKGTGGVRPQRQRFPVIITVKYRLHIKTNASIVQLDRESMTLIPHPNDPAITPSMLNPFNKTSGKAKGAEKEGETKPHKRFDPTAVECRSAEILYSQDRMKMKEPLPLEKLLRQPWTMEEPMSGLFKGYVGDLAGVTEIVTDAECEDSCFFSNLPIVAGSYGGDQRKGKKGIYYEVVIEKMEGEIAIGNP